MRFCVLRRDADSTHAARVPGPACHDRSDHWHVGKRERDEMLSWGVIEWLQEPRVLRLNYKFALRGLSSPADEYLAQQFRMGSDWAVVMLREMHRLRVSQRSFLKGEIE